MARLLDSEYPFPKYEDYNDWDKYFKASEEAFDNIPEDKVISFGVADGYANYFVVSLSPLVLQHIPYLDGYWIDYAHIRGLRREDVEKQIEGKKAMAKFFEKKQ